MSYKPLENYIRTHRVKHGLSQAELAVLVGAETRATASRYEQSIRRPNLEGAIALELILGAPVQELFAGIAERVREDVASRAASLLESLDDRPTRGYAQKLELLSRLARPDDQIIVPLWQDDE